MCIKLKNDYLQGFCILLLLSLFIPEADAATRKQCRDAMIVNQVQQLTFGTLAGTDSAGTVTVDTSGARSASGAVLAGGAVNVGVFEVYSKRNGCDVYPVRITYPNEAKKKLKNGSIKMPFDAFVSNPLSLFTLSPSKNVVTTVTIGSQLDVSANQSEGVYTGKYRVKFLHVKP